MANGCSRCVAIGRDAGVDSLLWIEDRALSSSTLERTGNGIRRCRPLGFIV